MIYRGGTYQVDRTLTSDGTTPIKPSTLDAIIIYVQHKTTKVLVQKYQYPLTAGYDLITVVDDAAGQIRFFIQEDDLEGIQAGISNIVELEYLLESTDVNYDSNTKREILVEDYDLIRDTEIKIF